MNRQTVDGQPGRNKTIILGETAATLGRMRCFQVPKKIEQDFEKRIADSFTLLEGTITVLGWERCGFNEGGEVLFRSSSSDLQLILKQVIELELSRGGIRMGEKIKKFYGFTVATTDKPSR